jgi:glutamyl-tRNA synthetase
MDARDEGNPVRVRIAPSPTGNCHVGTARNALYNLLYARQRGGAFVLRIDDTDTRRSTEASERGVLEGLRWLGLQWDEGPDVGGPYGPYRPSERLDRYQAAVAYMIDVGRAYYCFCTADEIARERAAARAAGIPYRYSGHCAALPPGEVRAKLHGRAANGEGTAVRFRIEPKLMAYHDLVQGTIEQDASLIGDPVIVRSDGMPTYGLATVVDEIDMRISHVLRGAEHISNTFLQLQLYEALGAAAPGFGHFGLLLNPDRSKISKRAGAVYIGAYRDMGYLPEALINHLALCGWSPGTDQEIWDWDGLLEAFSLERCTQSNAVFDRDKLLWLNGYYIRHLAPDLLAGRLAPFLSAAGILEGADLDGQVHDRLSRIAGLEQERLKTLVEAPETLGFYFLDPEPQACVALLRSNRFAARHSLASLGSALSAARARLQEVDEPAWAAPVLGELLDGLGDALGWKRAELLMPVRIAISGRAATPPLFETVALVGRAATLRRLEAVLAVLRCGEASPLPSAEAN